MKKKILIVDDEPRITEMLVKVLNAHGYETITAGDGLEGLEMVGKERPDLVLSDLMMPRMNGHTFCKMLKSEEDYKDIPVIMLTSSSEEQDRDWALKTGADAYINKPFILEDLLALLERFLGRKES